MIAGSRRGGLSAQINIERQAGLDTGVLEFAGRHAGGWLGQKQLMKHLILPCIFVPLLLSADG